MSDTDETNVERGRIPSYHLGKNSDLTVVVELQPGAGIAKVCEELCALAGRLQVYTKARFNDVTLIACPGGDPAILIANFGAVSASKYPNKIASCTSHTVSKIPLKTEERL